MRLIVALSSAAALAVGIDTTLMVWSFAVAYLKGTLSDSSLPPGYFVALDKSNIEYFLQN